LARSAGPRPANSCWGRRRVRRAQGSAVTPRSQLPVLAQIRGERRVYVFMCALALATISGTAITIWYNDLVRRDYGAAGVGTIATTYALILALCAIPSGILVDRVSARRLVVPALVGLAVMGCVSAIAFWAMIMTLPTMVAICTFEAIFFSVFVLSVFKIQATLVPTESRGAISLLHLAIVCASGILGVLLASARSGPTPWDFGSLIAFDLVAALLLFISTRRQGAQAAADTPSTPNTDSMRTPARTRGPAVLLAALREHPALRTVLALDLVLTVVLPTQLVSLYVADTMHEHLSSPLATTSFGASAAGAIYLLQRGLRPHLARTVRHAFISYALALALAIPLALVPPGPLRDASLIAVAALGIYSLVVGYGIISALVQQHCPQAIRGRITGVLSATRKLLVAAGVATATVISVRWNIPATLACYLALIGLTLILAKGFRGINDLV